MPTAGFHDFKYLRYWAYENCFQIKTESDCSHLWKAPTNLLFLVLFFKGLMCIY